MEDNSMVEDEALGLLHLRYRDRPAAKPVSKVKAQPPEHIRRLAEDEEEEPAPPLGKRRVSFFAKA